ncbi:hypothetical protein [Nocardia gipuzkoensis]
MSMADMAEIVLREAETEQETDWALLGQWVIETHVPEAGYCRECGQEWATFPDFPGCETYLQVRLQLVEIISGRVRRIMAKHKKGA